MLPQLIQHFHIYTTANKDNLKTNRDPTPYKRNKLIPNTTGTPPGHLSIVCHKT